MTNSTFSANNSVGFFIPKAVFAECDRIGNVKTHRLILQAVADDWLILRQVTESFVVDRMLSNLDRGEAEAIALAAEIGADILLIDELEGRSVARELGLTVRGVLGVLLRAKKTGRITAIKPEMTKPGSEFARIMPGTSRTPKFKGRRHRFSSHSAT